MSSPWDLSKLFSPPSSDASSGVSIPAINTPELKPSINLPPDGNSWQREALQSAGLIPLVPITDNLLKTQSPISAWQQTNTNSFNPTVQPQSRYHSKPFFSIASPLLTVSTVLHRSQASLKIIIKNDKAEVLNIISFLLRNFHGNISEK